LVSVGQPIIDNKYFKKVAFMSLEQLYQEQILALARSARESAALETAEYTATIKNPTCGDRVRVDLDLDGEGRITRIGAVADGCALCEAATGLLLTTVQGRYADDVQSYGVLIEAWLKGQSDTSSLEGQDAFTPVKTFASRHGCVCLPFQVIAKALSSDNNSEG
jgi:nitrogen fixation NifU-like protein